MINAEVKFYDDPAMFDEEKNKVIDYTKRYTFKRKGKRPEVAINEQVNEIFKRYKGVHSIRFYVNKKRRK